MNAAIVLNMQWQMEYDFFSIQMEFIWQQITPQTEAEAYLAASIIARTDDLDIWLVTFDRSLPEATKQSRQNEYNNEFRKLWKKFILILFIYVSEYLKDPSAKKLFATIFVEINSFEIFFVYRLRRICVKVGQRNELIH